MKLLLLFCEGPHDVALIYKVIRLGISGADDISSTRIGEFPEKLKKYFLQKITGFDYEDSNLTIRPEIPTPLKVGEIFILIFPLGGDTKVEIWKKHIQDFIDFIPPGVGTGDDQMSLALFFDADQDGIENKLNKIQATYKDLVPEISNISITQRITRASIYTQLGVYIFCDLQGNGNLEDILLPLMRPGNESIFDAAETYIHTYKDENRPTVQKFKKSFDKNKAIIGTAGQLQFSGVPNQNIIKQSDFITEEKINKHPQVIEIKAFIETLLKNL